MSTLFKSFTSLPSSLPAIIVPTVIMLIFSFFTLTAAPDPVRAAKSFNLGIVNQDTGIIFPPINFASKVLEGVGQNLPFTITEIETPEDAHIALEEGRIAAAILFPQDFTKNAMGEENFEIEVLNAQHLTVSETQVAAQLPTMIQMAMSAGVANLRLAFAKGKLPTDGFPVTTKVTTLHKAENTAMMVAPVVMTNVAWLAAFVGAILLFFASKDFGSPKQRAVLRTILPIGSIGVASLVLSLVIAATSAQWASIFAVWLTMWVAALCLTWLFGGIFALLGPFAAVLVLPFVFYQGAIGGALSPLGAAPTWLQSVGNTVPFDEIGAAFRGVIHGAAFDLPLLWLAAAAIIGLTLIWTKALIQRP